MENEENSKSQQDVQEKTSDETCNEAQAGRLNRLSCALVEMFNASDASYAEKLEILLDILCTNFLQKSGMREEEVKRVFSNYTSEFFKLQREKNKSLPH